MGENVQDDPFYAPLEMVQQRQEVTKREMMAIFTRVFGDVALGLKGGGDGDTNISEGDERTDQAPHGRFRP